MQTAVIAAMADQKLGTIAGGTLNDPALQDVTVGTTTVGAFIVGGVAKVHGTYTIGTDGTITAHTYP